MGDSYYWNMHIYMSSMEFRNCAFWYYFDNIYFQNAPMISAVEAHAHLKEILLRQNIICIMETDAALGSLGLDLPEQANAAFKNN